jgi:uncharacterized protein (TIGR03067 family)
LPAVFNDEMWLNRRNPMTVRSFVVIGLIAFTSIAIADDKKQADEFKKMDGTWLVVKGELGGTALPEEVTKTFTLTLAGGKYAVKVGGQDDKGTCTIDPTKKPKELDIKGEEGPNKGKTIPCIYDLDGDTLKVCYDLSGKKRPTEFKTEKDTLLYLAVYKRQKP